MPTLYVRDVPADVYRALHERADEEGRSLSAEAIWLLRRALEHESDDDRRRQAHRAALARLREFRDSATLPPAHLDSVEALREDRER